MNDKRLTWDDYLDWAGGNAMPQDTWTQIRALFPDASTAQMHRWWTDNPNKPADQYRDPWH